MQIVIDIDEKWYDKLHNNRLIIKNMRESRILMSDLWDAVKNGMPLPRDHGQLIDADKLISQLRKSSLYIQDERIDYICDILKQETVLVEPVKEDQRMGMRIHITAENGDSYGDDHKFYGYYDYIYVKHSFEVIYPLLKEQWDYVRDECNTIEEAYEYFKWTPFTGNVIVPEDIFKKFAAEYLADLINSDKEPKVVYDIALYLAKLMKTPGDKNIEWC